MSLRVTSGMMNTQLLRNLNANMQRMDRVQTQMSTGMKINRPSDDPVGITYSIRYRSELAANEQYQRNVDSSLSWLEFNDTVLGQANEVFQRLRELTVQGATGSNPQSALDAINNEVKELKGQLLDIANSQMNGKYVLNGEKLDQKPYPDNVSASMTETDGYLFSLDVGSGAKVAANLSGNDIFGKAGEADNAFRVIDELSAALAAGDSGGVSQALTGIQTRMDKILYSRSEVGARINRVELMENRLNDLKVNLTDLQSKTEDVDYEKLIIESKVVESVYQASLAVGSKIIQPSLVDFIR